MTAPAPAIQHVRVSTRDVEQGHEHIRQMYVDSRLRTRGSAENFVFFSDLLLIGGGFFLGRLVHSMAVDFEADQGVDQMSVFQARRPSLTVGPRGRQTPMAAGSPMCIPVGIPYLASWQTLDVDTVMLGTDVVADTAAALLDPGQPLRFDFDHVISPAAADTWLRTCGLVRSVAAAHAARPDGVLLADQLTRLLASTALICFANTTMADPAVKPTRSTPESLRRAVAYIESNLDQPIRLIDLAAAAGVSQRALNLTFNRHHDISPVGYIRRARLDAAHRDLQAAEPGDGQSVTAIAAKWGFYDLPRFGVYYRHAYGGAPSHTLRNQEEAP